jgi:hypothetical protein
MPEPADSEAEETGPQGGQVRHLPVLSDAVEAHPVEASPRALGRPLLRDLPAPVIAATGGFLAGVATFVLVRVLRQRRVPRALARRSKRGRGIEVAGTRSFLVDVHLLKR